MGIQWVVSKEQSIQEPIKFVDLREFSAPDLGCCEGRCFVAYC